MWIEVAIVRVGPGVGMQVYDHVVAIYHSMTENYDMVFTKCMGKIQLVLDLWAMVYYIPTAKKR